MKKDNLEQFISDNRADFDNAIPSLKVWANIDKALDQKEKPIAIAWWRKTRVAAAAAVLILAGIGLGFFLGNNRSQAALASEMSAEYTDMMAYYERQLQDKTVRLASYQYDAVAVNQDLGSIDEAMNELKQELQHVEKGNEEKVIHALIQNYQAKILVLDRVLQQLNYSEKTTKNNNDGSVKL